MKILVTGGAGFIGSHLIDFLIAENHTIVAVDNLVMGTTKNIQHLENHEVFKFIIADVADYNQIRDIFAAEHFDVVFHMAANSDIQKGGQNPLVDYELTFMTTFQILRCMREFEVKRLIFASTSAIYGETKDMLNEDYGPLLPVSMYGASKLASEAYIYAFCANSGIQVWVTRFPNVVGERFTHGVIFDFVQKLKIDSTRLEILGNGEQNKPYLYVKDLVAGILFCWKNAHDQINIYNLGVETRTRVREIAEIVIEEMGLQQKVLIQYTGGDRGWVGDVPEFRYDLSKVHALGWSATRTSNESVRIAVKRALGKE